MYLRLITLRPRLRFYATLRNIHDKINNGPVVKIKEGKIQGSIANLRDGDFYYSFKGIPYVQAPVGELRFKVNDEAPLPIKPWIGTHVATKHGPKCPQYNMLIRQIIKGDENCLHINVYTKSLQPSSKLPVMVYIYYGGYIWGYSDSDLYGPELLLQHDVVLVTFNFRSELLGFLCLDTPEVPGNAGMKDQVAALNWVQNNVGQFGGDRDNVTLFGISSGAASVTYHMLSPMSKGLFHKAIAQSGVCITDWTQGRYSKERLFRVGKELGCNTDNIPDLINFLRSLPAENLVNRISSKTLTKEESLRDLPSKFVPVVEKRFKNVQPFLSEDPLKLILTGKIQNVPLVIGHTDSEGVMLINQIFKHLDHLNKYPFCLIREEVVRNITVNKLKDFGERAKKFYIGDKNWTKEDYQSVCDFASDIHFTYGVHRFVNLYSKLCNQIYMYRFSYNTDLNLFKTLFGYKHMKGASHADDDFYIFSKELTKSIFETQPELLQKTYIVTKMWTDFAKTGNPTPHNTVGVKWQPYTREKKEYLNIGDPLSMGEFRKKPERDRMMFWDQLYKEAGLPCISTSDS